MCLNHSYSSDVSGLCLDVVSVLALEVHRRELQAAPMGQALEPFLRLLLEMVLLQPLDAELTLVTGGALFALLCCFQVMKQYRVGKASRTLITRPPNRRALPSWDRRWWPANRTPPFASVSPSAWRP